MLVPHVKSEPIARKIDIEDDEPVRCVLACLLVWQSAHLVSFSQVLDTLAAQLASHGVPDTLIASASSYAPQALSELLAMIDAYPRAFNLLLVHFLRSAQNAPRKHRGKK